VGGGQRPAVIDDRVRTGKRLPTYISEPDRGRQHWNYQRAERDAVYANRRRLRGDRGQQLMGRRGEFLGRRNAHLYDAGTMRRTHLLGHGNILKRLLVHVAAGNLGLWMHTLIGIGTPRGLQSRLVTVLAIFFLCGCFCATK
jgi:transposase